MVAFVEETRDKGTAVMDEWSVTAEPDREAYYGTPNAPLLARALTESLVVSGAGWVDDGPAFVSPWGFELSSISTPVAVWAGAIDRLVPVGHARYLAANIPGADAAHRARPRPRTDDYPIFEWLARAMTSDTSVVWILLEDGRPLGD